MTMTGRCHCGAVRYRAQGDPEHHALCHCGDCRHCAGAPAVAWMAFRERDVAIDGTPAEYASSEHGRRAFCATCGTGLFYRNAVVLPGIVDIQSMTLDDAGARAPGAEIQVAERAAWMPPIPGLPQFARYPGMD